MTKTFQCGIIKNILCLSQWCVGEGASFSHAAIFRTIYNNQSKQKVLDQPIESCSSRQVHRQRTLDRGEWMKNMGLEHTAAHSYIKQNG